MGLFGRGMNKPGKGVEKDERQKHRFFIFFDVLFRKFMKFMQINMLFLLFSLPYLLLLYWAGRRSASRRFPALLCPVSANLSKACPMRTRLRLSLYCVCFLRSAL